MQNFLDIDQVDPQKLRGILDEAARIKTARAVCPRACWMLNAH